ncbi:hypothetical protein [Streptomyces scopuliridis]|nr:hypothetical protein [Streptomyces scopuliridis]
MTAQTVAPNPVTLGLAAGAGAAYAGALGPYDRRRPMHTATAPITLEFWKEGRAYERRAGYRGASPEFGEIVLTCPLPRQSTVPIQCA